MYVGSTKINYYDQEEESGWMDVWIIEVVLWSILYGYIEDYDLKEKR